MPWQQLCPKQLGTPVSARVLPPYPGQRKAACLFICAEPAPLGDCRAAQASCMLTYQHWWATCTPHHPCTLGPVATMRSSAKRFD